MFGQAVFGDDHVRITSAIAIDNIGSMWPDVTVGSDGSAWVVWSRRDPVDGERILARRFDESGSGAILDVGTRSGIELQPCITNLAHGSHRVFWIAYRDDEWHLMTRSFRDETFGTEVKVTSCRDGLFSPRAAIDSSGNCWVVCEKVVGQRTRLALFRQAKDSWIHIPIETLEGDCYRPDICLGPMNTLWISYDEFGPRRAGMGSEEVRAEESAVGNYRVAIQPIAESRPTSAEGASAEVVSSGKTSSTKLELPTSELSASELPTSAYPESESSQGAIQEASFPFVVADSGYQNLHSSLTADASGNLWVAFASNRNDARRDPAWMTKWSYVYRFDGQVLSEPAGHRPDVDVYNEHAYQGWEFPAVGIGDDGTVVLVGQSAHSILVQSYSGDSWSAAHTIVERKWGSWKPRCRVAGSGPMYLVSMGLSGAQIQRIVTGDSTNTRLGDISNAAASADIHRADTDSAHPTNDPLLVPTGAPLPAVPSIEISTGDTVNIRRKEGRPSIVMPDGSQHNIYFGDLHAHSAYSDAVGDVDEFYHRYRDTYGYDFAALTDHDYLDGIELSNSELQMIWNHADRFSTDEEFLAWYGYEWTSPAISVHAAEGTAVGEGHRHILHPDKSGPLIGYGNSDSNTGAKLLAKLKGIRALVIPHHTSWSGTDWDAHDPELQRVVEMVSAHGRFEYPGNKPIGYRRDHTHADKTVLDALNRGYKLGFVGGSDSHGLRWHAIELEGRAKHIPHGTRVGYKEDAYRTGMTAILSDKLDRQSLFDAIYERRCYATSGVPIVLDFRINGAIMGSEIVTSDKPLLTVNVEGTDALRSVEIIRSGHVFGGMQMQPGEGIATIQFEMEDTMLIPGEGAYYYLRVLQEDGNMAWSSPIWVRYEN